MKKSSFRGVFLQGGGFFCAFPFFRALRIEYIITYMKSRCFCIVFCVIAMILLNGCAIDYSDSYEETIDLSGFINQETSIAMVDSAVQQTIKPGRYGFDVDVGWFRSSVELEGITLLASVFICPSSGDSCKVKPKSARVIKEFYVDLYGCSTGDCSDTKRVVFRDSLYENIRAFNRDQFKLKETESFSYLPFGDECTLRKILNFNLFIDEPDFKVDWDIKYGNITCSGTNYHYPRIEHIHIAG